MLRYYPSFRIKTDLITQGAEYMSGNVPYKGKYYITYDGKAFSGANPIVGPNYPLVKIDEAYTSDIDSNLRAQGPDISLLPNNLPTQLRRDAIRRLNATKRGTPVPHFPIPTEADYKKGYIMRSFIKKINDAGFITEISPEEYDNFQNGTVDYDVSFYLTYQIMWKITGPLNNTRLGQYETRAGIIDTNKRLVETANKTFLGITDFIGGDYTKFARPSAL